MPRTGWRRGPTWASLLFVLIGCRPDASEECAQPTWPRDAKYEATVTSNHSITAATVEVANGILTLRWTDEAGSHSKDYLIEGFDSGDAATNRNGERLLSFESTEPE